MTHSLSHRRASLVPTIAVSAPEEDEEKQKGKGKKVEFC